MHTWWTKQKGEWWKKLCEQYANVLNCKALEEYQRLALQVSRNTPDPLNGRAPCGWYTEVFPWINFNYTYIYIFFYALKIAPSRFLFQRKVARRLRVTSVKYWLKNARIRVPFLPLAGRCKDVQSSEIHGGCRGWFKDETCPTWGTTMNWRSACFSLYIGRRSDVTDLWDQWENEACTTVASGVKV